ncbi:MAG: hypothetical protein OXG34_15010 [bacterium]|nr:hypothetical protein [bacterium]
MAWWPWTRCRWPWWAKADQPGVNAVELMPSAILDPGGVVALDSISPAWRWTRSLVLWWTPGALWWAKPNP